MPGRASLPPHAVGGRWRAQRLLGAGGFGTVYEARHERTEQLAALKVLALGDARNAERFQVEVTVAARLGHPGLVTVYDAGVDEATGALYVAMELLAGAPLDALIARGGLDLGRAVEILCEVLDALATAHARDLVHRDLKPENVYVARGAGGVERARLLDFGIAKYLTETSGAASKTVVGTPCYMSPEQFRGGPIGAASDVWAVGVMLYELAAGRQPFDAPAPGAIAARVMTGDHVPLAEAAPEIHPAFAALVERCLSLDTASRPADAFALRADLARLLARPEVAATIRGRPVGATRQRLASCTVRSVGDDQGGPLPPTPRVPATVVREVSAAALSGWAGTRTTSAPSRRVLLAGLAAAGLVAVGVIVTAVLAGTGPTAPAGEPAPMRVPAPSTSTSVPAANETVAGDPGPRGTPATAASAARPSTPVPSNPATPPVPPVPTVPPLQPLQPRNVQVGEEVYYYRRPDGRAADAPPVVGRGRVALVAGDRAMIGGVEVDAGDTLPVTASPGQACVPGQVALASLVVGRSGDRAESIAVGIAQSTPAGDTVELMTCGDDGSRTASVHVERLVLVPEPLARDLTEHLRRCVAASSQRAARLRRADEACRAKGPQHVLRGGRCIYDPFSGRGVRF